MKYLLIAALILVATFSGIRPVQAQTKEPVVIFFNEACQDCAELIKSVYPPLFTEYGYDLILNDYIGNRENRNLLNQYNTAWGVPFALQSHIETFIDDRLLIGGHVPEAVIRYLLENPSRYEKLLVYQDEMHGEASEYSVWNFSGEVKTYALNEPITTYLDENPPTPPAPAVKEPTGFWRLWPIITLSAFVDGLNPCAFAVLLFFIAFLFTMKRTFRTIWKMGLTYVSAIFLAYLLIGLGVAQAIVISGSPHLMAKIGAYLVIALGIIQTITVFFPAFPIRLRIPTDTKAVLEKWMYKATLPASFVGGFLVGLCTFPCSGGIYVAIIGMLGASQTALKGFLWLLWYNLIFISPLLIILALSGNRRAAENMQKLERLESKKIKILVGAFMIALGAAILVFFT